MHRQRLIIYGFLFVSCIAAITEAKSPPNILFFYTDDHSYRTVGCYPESYPFVKTPNMDQLAANGIRFKYAYIGTWCMPSRATLLTGHYQHAIESMRMEGPYPGSTYDPKKCPFWPSVFRQHGYQTAQIGKWHTGTDTGYGRDWDYQVVWNRPRPESRPGNYYKEQGIEDNGKPIKIVPGYSTDNYTKWAVDYLKGKGRDPDKPWYLWLCYGAVHGPYTPAKRHQADFPDIKVPTPADIFPPRPGKPQYMQEIARWFKGDDGQPHLKGRRRATGEQSPGTGLHGSTLTDWVRQYHQGVLALDEALGKIVQTLKETGQYDNTLIVFTSDQGFAWGQHGFCAKVAPYDATIRSPLIVSMPKSLPSKAVCNAPVGGTDLVPTFFELAGIPLPWKMHGHSIVPLLKKPSTPWKHPLLTTFTGRQYGSDTDTIPTDKAVIRKISATPWYASLHDGRYKYVRLFEANEIEELYDLEKDPKELTNLALDMAQRKRLRSMRAQTVEELKRTDAGFVNNLPPVREATR